MKFVSHKEVSVHVLLIPYRLHIPRVVVEEPVS